MTFEEARALRAYSERISREAGAATQGARKATRRLTAAYDWNDGARERLAAARDRSASLKPARSRTVTPPLT